MKPFNFPPGYVNFIFLAPLLIKGTGGKPMSAAEIMQQFQGNTVVIELPEGKAYDYIRADGEQAIAGIDLVGAAVMMKPLCSDTKLTVKTTRRCQRSTVRS